MSVHGICLRCRLRLLDKAIPRHRLGQRRSVHSVDTVLDETSPDPLSASIRKAFAFAADQSSQTGQQSKTTEARERPQNPAGKAPSIRKWPDTKQTRSSNERRSTQRTATTRESRPAGRYTGGLDHGVDAEVMAESGIAYIKNITSLEELAGQIDKSLARFRERENLDKAEELWRLFEERLSVLSDSDKQKASAYKIFEEFLLTFRSLRRADHTTTVWNAMITNGLTPTVRTWNVMLKGCHIGREVRAMEQLWGRMLQAGIRPNAISWGVRINGLFRFDQVAAGFEALSELTRNAASPGKRGDAGQPLDSAEPAPTTAIWNNALSGSAHIGPKVVAQIVAWGQSQGLEPDAKTYNVLLNVALAAGNRKQAMQIFGQMKGHGVKPDSDTFTILLHSILSEDYLSGLSPAEQTTQSMNFIRMLENHGMEVDTRSYALLLDRLLKLYDNTVAATAVLEHMATRGVRPTTHINTILATHYFSRSEVPGAEDLAAIDRLWRDITSQENYVVDVIFYDRMLEGYARARDMGRMMYFLTRMSREGKRPGWLALTEVLRCMLERGDRDRARELVIDVRQAEGAVRSGVRGAKGADGFWALVRETGIDR